DIPAFSARSTRCPDSFDYQYIQRFRTYIFLLCVSQSKMPIYQMTPTGNHALANRQAPPLKITLNKNTIRNYTELRPPASKKSPTFHPFQCPCSMAKMNPFIFSVFHPFIQPQSPNLRLMNRF